MAKNSITDYSKTAASNTDIQSVDIDEGCLPSGINNAIRELMADLAEMNDGTVTLTSPSFAAATITGDLTVDTSTLKVDSTNNRVGIGTSSPSTNLTVSSGASSAAVHSYTKLEIESSSHGALQLSGSTGAEQWIWFADDTSATPVGGITYYHGGPYMGFRVEGSERMRIDSSGNVKIGSSLTAGKLGVYGDSLNFSPSADNSSNGIGCCTLGSNVATASSALARLYMSGANSAHAGNLDLRSGSVIESTLNMYAVSGTKTVFLTTNGDSYINGGNVGIGTTSPYAPLTVDTANGILNIANGNTSGGTKIQAWGATPSNGYLAIEGYTKEYMRIDSSGRVGIGTSSVFSPLHLGGGEAAPSTSGNMANNGLTISNGVGGRAIQIGVDDTAQGAYIQSGYVNNSNVANSLFFYNGANESMRIDSSGNVGIGTTSPSQPLHISGIAKADAGFLINNSYLYEGATDQLNIRVGADGPYVEFIDAGSNVLEFGNSSDALALTSAGTERMRIDSSGYVFIGRTAAHSIYSGTDTGVSLFPAGSGYFYRDSFAPLILGRQTSDGNMLHFHQDGTLEGVITVSGSTVSYNGGHLARWSQLTDNTKDETIVKGTVMTNLDQMAVWSHDAVEAQDAVYDEDGNIVTEAVEAKDAYTEDNEQLNCMAVSSVEGDPNVAGVFVNWDDDDDEFNDMNIAMTGDMVIRIAQGTTVARGDLLVSAGDGTAKPQGDDIVRSKTIAKVTSTNVSHTYDDGSYLVPCVLMAC